MILALAVVARNTSIATAEIKKLLQYRSTMPDEKKTLFVRRFLSQYWAKTNPSFVERLKNLMHHFIPYNFINSSYFLSLREF